MFTTSPASATTAPLQLSKWYLDCVNKKGDGAIVYLAELRWKKVHLRYANLLLFLDGKVTRKSSIRDCDLPCSSGEEIKVKVPHLRIDGVWRRAADALEATVFSGTEGQVVWKCVQPSSRVRLCVGRATEIVGLGYAELLQMTIPPWKLPLTELHWGRFVSESNYIVWIDWRGSHQFRLLAHAGARHAEGLVTEREIRLGTPSLRLTLDRGLVLRSGALGDTVMPALSSLAKILPDSLLGVNECKWRSRAVLSGGDRIDEGWAIHEVVRWRSE